MILLEHKNIPITSILLISTLCLICHTYATNDIEQPIEQTTKDAEAFVEPEAVEQDLGDLVATTQTPTTTTVANELNETEVSVIEEDNLRYSISNNDGSNSSYDEDEDYNAHGKKDEHDNVAHGERRRFVLDLLQMLHEQYAKTNKINLVNEHINAQQKFDGPSMRNKQASIRQLLDAIGSNGDMRRLIDWAKNSFNLASIGEIATQIVVSKLGSINCGALFEPDAEDTLMPRFLLFNEHFPDVPFELSINPTTNECIAQSKFDPLRKTIVLLHGYLSGYTILDSLTNIKNRVLDINKSVVERAMQMFERAHESNGSYVLTDDLEATIRQHQYNVVIVDWFNGANPVPRSNYIKASVNAQVVGQLIARFLSALVVRCGTPASNLQIIAHSLGCHVAGFTGKAMNLNGHRLGKITHLDPIGLCFGRLFSEPRLRLSSDDAIETQAVHVSLNLFDNPLDGAQANFLVSGGRDQIGCGGESELKNSTTSSVSLLFDSEAGFTPCSHVRALALYEDDLSGAPGHQCQLVGYRCSSYERFLAGKCGQCDSMNNQCRLMGFPAIALNFRRMSLATHSRPKQRDLTVELALSNMKDIYSSESDKKYMNARDSNEIKRVDRRLTSEQRDKLVRAVDKIKSDARYVLAEGWTSLSGVSEIKQKALSQISVKLLNRVPLNMSGNNSSTNDHDSTSSTKAQGADTFQNRQHTEQPFEFDLVTMPVGGQVPPAGSLLGPLYYLGTGAITPYCVNYYQFRLLIAESRIDRLIKSNSLAPHKLAPITTQNGKRLRDYAHRIVTTSRSILHLTIKLMDTSGHFFKGFTLKEDAKKLPRVSSELQLGHTPSETGKLVELTMLLNTTLMEPTRIGEVIISYYFHGIVLADRIELNYMSNISPDIRAKYSSTLCPLAINEQHQLVKYIECDKLVTKRK